MSRIQLNVYSKLAEAEKQLVEEKVLTARIR